jgi:threonine/homoserine/homoserine lactone efflux protein
MTVFGISDYGTYCVAIVVFLALPGPGTFCLLTSTAKGGFRAGAAATVGVILGDQVLLWLAVAGVSALLASHPTAFKAVQWAGALYLAWIGIRLLRYKEGDASPIRIEPRQYLRQAAVITLLNPKAIVFYMAFFPLFINPQTHQGGVTFAAMAATIAFITAVYCLTLCGFATAISAKVRSHKRLARWLHRLAGIFMIGFGIRLASN